MLSTTEQKQRILPTVDSEISLTKRFIEKMPNNESVWNYLAGLLLETGVSSRPDVVAFVEDLYERTEPPSRAPYLVSFLCDILLENISKTTSMLLRTAREQKRPDEGGGIFRPTSVDFLLKLAIQRAHSLRPNSSELLETPDEGRGQFVGKALLQNSSQMIFGIVGEKATLMILFLSSYQSIIMGLGLDHKVLVVLDHGPRFARKAGNPLSITLKESSVNRTVGKCDKSLWTWCVEATLELHRTVSDLFSQERDPSSARLMRLVLADYVGRVLQPRWGTQLVTQQELLASLSAIGLPSTNDDSESLALSGVTLAIEALSQLSEAQIKGEKNESSNEKKCSVSKERSSFSREPKCWEDPSPSSVAPETDRKVVENCGSVVIFTAYAEDERLTELENEVADMINGRNRIIKSLQDSSLFVIRKLFCRFVQLFTHFQIFLHKSCEAIHH
ncbi:hypothetical protein COOONC_11213 [Cooperia oncophora]